MGWFSRKKGNKPEPKVERLNVNGLNLNSDTVGHSTPQMDDNMVDLIKKEQDEILNPFKAPDEPKTYAKKMALKKVGYFQSGQQALTKVVDTRSYVKPKEEKKNKYGFVDELKNVGEPIFNYGEDDKPKHTKLNSSTEQKTEIKKTSFFDELMKELENDNKDKSRDDLDDLDDFDDLFDDEPTKKPEPVKKTVAKTVVKTKKQKKKSVDIDIISGDFGGTDIL